MEIYLIRHGQTPWNSERRFQGRTDIELNEYGREVAGITGRALENVDFDLIYSSPLMRAYETACLIRGHRNIRIIRDDRMREMSFGENEGRLEKDILEEEGNTFKYFFTHPELYVAGNGAESFEELIKRSGQFLDEVCKNAANLNLKHNRIMIVGHGAINKSIMCYIENRPVADFWKGDLQKNCCVTIIDYDEKTGNYKVVKSAVNYI